MMRPLNKPGNKSQIKAALIFGTRPEIIKLSSLMRLMESSKVPYLMIHTGQHYSANLDEIFFKQLELPKPKYNLRVKSKAPELQGYHTGKMLIEIEKILLKESPTHVLVQGDTNTVLAGALAASKISTTSSFTGLRYVLGHVEAGLRSYDRQMPEEINRFISDHLSDLLFTPTKHSRKILINEGIDPAKIFITGNTIVDAVFQNLEIAKKSVSKNFYKRGDYLLATLHRQENVDEPNRLKGILKGIEIAAHELKKKVLIPLHPRTQLKMKTFGISLPSSFEVMDPIGFLEFLMLESHASLIMTDSGGVQEEACILKVPCVTLRTTTERPETIGVGANELSGVESENILRAAKKMINRPREWENPFGDGRAAHTILQALLH